MTIYEKNEELMNDYAQKLMEQHHEQYKSMFTGKPAKFKMGEKLVKRSEILREAEKCVCGDREQDYGTPEDNFGTIGQLWTTYLQTVHPTDYIITSKDVAVMMALLKVARIARGSKADSYIDLAGYAACAGEIDSKE